MSIAEEGWELDIDSVVGEPYGLKYVLLRKLSRKSLLNTLTKFGNYSLMSGVGIVVEFRELGSYGASLGKLSKLIHYLLFMPSTHDLRAINELREAINYCDGLGISSPHYFDPNVLKELVNTTRRYRKLVLSHVSEVKEVHDLNDFDYLLKVGKPDAIIHGYWLSEDELLTAKELGVTVVICPRSATWFLSGEPRIDLLYGLGINVCLGTDNAGWVSPDIWRELEFTALLMRRYCGLIDAKWLLKLVTTNVSSIIGIRNVISEGELANITLLNSELINLNVVRNKYLSIVKRGCPEAVEAVLINGGVAYDRRGRLKALRSSLRN